MKTIIFVILIHIINYLGNDSIQEDNTMIFFGKHWYSIRIIWDRS